jgi:hypothetical protein
MEVRKCSKCYQVKDINEFYKHKRSPGGYFSSCKSCERPYYNKKSIQYYSQFTVEQLEHKKQKNKEYWKIYGPQRIKNDLEYKLRVRLSSSLSRTIKKYSLFKEETPSTFNLLDISLPEFINYIEAKWVKGYMNWENYGEIWELDHIKGIVNFDLTDELQLKECWHYTNFQPLFKITTIIDGIEYEGNRNKSKFNLE